MTNSSLNTDIIVIVVLIVVLILIGVIAFFTHFYWTKIGVAEIWNTAKWSSMRSSFYQTLRRFSRASSSKYGSERPFSAASAYSNETDGDTLPAPLRNDKSNKITNPNAHPHETQPSTILKSSSTNNKGRRNSSNQVQPVTTISYNNKYKIHNVHENDDGYDDPSVNIQTHRF